VQVRIPGFEELVVTLTKPLLKGVTLGIVSVQERIDSCKWLVSTIAWRRERGGRRHFTWNAPKLSVCATSSSIDNRPPQMVRLGAICTRFASGRKLSDSR